LLSGLAATSGSRGPWMDSAKQGGALLGSRRHIANDARPNRSVFREHHERLLQRFELAGHERRVTEQMPVREPL
jgi:hypothetical protein